MDKLVEAATAAAPSDDAYYDQPTGVGTIRLVAIGHYTTITIGEDTHKTYVLEYLIELAPGQRVAVSRDDFMALRALRGLDAPL